MKKISILGATGSIGINAVKVVESHPDRFRTVALTGNSNIELLAEQARRLRPQIIGVPDPEKAREVASMVDIRVVSGIEGLIECATHPEADIVLSAIVGSAGLRPTMAALLAGKDIALANKETLVMAGDLFMAKASETGSAILPVDSEHSAVFQCLEGRAGNPVLNIILTASGGPFVGLSAHELSSKTPADALRHPSWSMGRKISIDSATLMNKGLEVIEAHYLFGAAPDNIKVLVHPQSIIHSMVEFRDHTCIAQLSVPDMKGAIAYALSYPVRLADIMEPLDLTRVGTLEFKAPDTEAFPCLGYAYEALLEGGAMPTVLNSANEVAVDLFLAGRIGFNGIPALIRRTMDALDNHTPGSIDDIIAAHEWARARASELAG